MSTTVPGIPVSPVTRERIGGLLDAQEWPYDTDEEGDFCLRFNGDLHTIATFGEREEVVNVVSWMPEDIPMELLDESRAAIEDWRREHLFPTLFWRENDDAGMTLSIGCAVAVDWEPGATDKQLINHFHVAFTSSNDAFTLIRGRLGLPGPETWK